ncbi:hypothetical protein C0995_003576 [Termitomyces sp. Mi166|nr:hypothetical protein C0995_003576 [Termitomyces sp. Mi166\
MPSEQFGQENSSKAEGSDALQSVSKLPATTEKVEVLSPKRDLRFWLVFVALCCCTILSAIDLAGVSTAAPTIVHALEGDSFAWVFSAYALSSSACVPLSGNLAQIFGRRPILQLGIVLFAAGSAIAGAAPTMTILIVGRGGCCSVLANTKERQGLCGFVVAIQGVGGGIIQSLSAIVTADLVPLRERGLFTGITGLMWTLGSAIAPFVAGGLSEKASWRWLFYINLPLCGLAFGVVTLFLRLKTPTETFRSKFFKIDWIGNAIILASACSCMIALTWGGIEYPWSSYHILVPLILGIAGLAFALLYEAKWAGQPAVPWVVLANRTSISGYVGTFVSGMANINIGCKSITTRFRRPTDTLYRLSVSIIESRLISFLIDPHHDRPTWFQAVQDASPITSGLHFMPWAVSISGFAIVGGLIVARIGKYKLVNLIAWCILLLGMGLLITLKLKTSIGLLILYQLIMGTAGGLLYTSAFAVLSPLPVTENAPAVAVLTFSRVFSQAWGVAVGGTVFQNALKRKLPADLLHQFPANADITYYIVPEIPMLSEPLKHDVRIAFLQSFRVLWIAAEIMVAIGASTVLFMKDLPLRRTVDKDWGLEKKGDEEEAAKESVPTSKQDSAEEKEKENEKS